MSRHNLRGPDGRFIPRTTTTTTTTTKKSERVYYRDQESGRFISKREYESRQEKHLSSFRQRLAYGEPLDGVRVQGEGNHYSIFVKAVSKDGYITYHELLQNSPRLTEEGIRLIKEKARERYDHHGRIIITPLHTIDNATGEVIRGPRLWGDI